MSIRRASRCSAAGRPTGPLGHPIRKLAPAAGLALAASLLAACGDFLANIPGRPAASDDPAVAEAPYPSLATVPARPQLTYTLEQRREIAQGLVADRANARHVGDTLRQDLGRPVLPDTAPPLPPAPVAAPPPPAGDAGADLALAYVEEALARDADDGSLGDFLDRLERRPPALAEARPSQPAPAAPEAAEPPVPAEEPVAASDPLVEPAPSAAVAVAAEPPPPGEPTMADPPLAAAAAQPVAEPPMVTAALPPETAIAPPEAAPGGPPLPLAIVFAPDAVVIADEARERLQGLAMRLDRNGAAPTIVVSGGGERAGLAMERARRVAAMLVQAGVPPARIAIEMGGESDVVVVYEAGT